MFTNKQIQAEFCVIRPWVIFCGNKLLKDQFWTTWKIQTEIVWSFVLVYLTTIFFFLRWYILHRYAKGSSNVSQVVSGSLKNSVISVVSAQTWLGHPGSPFQCNSVLINDYNGFCNRCPEILTSSTLPNNEWIWHWNGGWGNHSVYVLYS